MPVCHCFCGYTLTIPPPHTLPYYPRTQHPPCPLSQAMTIWGGLPPRSWARGSDTMIGARQRCYLSSYSPLPAPYAAKTSHPASHPHNTLACNQTSLPPPPREGMVTERPRNKKNIYLNCTPSKSRSYEPILLLLVFNSVQL